MNKGSSMLHDSEMRVKTVERSKTNYCYGWK